MRAESTISIVLIWLPHRLEPRCARGVAHQDEIIRFFTPKIFTISISQLSTTNSYTRRYFAGNSDVAIHRHFHILSVSHRRKFAENSMSSRFRFSHFSTVFHERFGFELCGAWISITLWMMLSMVFHHRCFFHLLLAAFTRIKLIDVVLMLVSLHQHICINTMVLIN